MIATDDASDMLVADTAADGTAGRNATILVADDEPALLRLMSFVLQKQGYTLLMANNGADALQITREARPDLVVLDIMMPFMDGFTVAENIRADANAAIAATPIVMLSAKAQDEDIVRGLDAGVDTYITKPFAPEQLAQVVADLLRGKNAIASISGDTVVKRPDEPETLSRNV